MEKQNVSENVLKHKALEFIRSLTSKQIDEVLGEGDVMFNDHLDCFFVWRDHRLVMYVNETECDRGGRGLGMDQVKEEVEESEFDICETCGEKIFEPGRIVLENGETFHYNFQCNPIKTKDKTKE